MNVRLPRPLGRFPAIALIGLIGWHLSAPQPSSADDYPTTCNYCQDLCGWVEPGTVERQAVESRSDESRSADSGNVASQRGDTFAADPLATIKAIDLCTAQAIEALRHMNRWWKAGQDLTDRIAAFQWKMAMVAVATREPLDVESLGRSVLEPAAPPPAGGDRSGVAVALDAPFVGTAPLIATIEEAYLPYDLSAADLRLRSIYPVTAEPFCVRSRVAGWIQQPLRPEIIETAAPRTAAVRATDRQLDTVMTGPVDCWWEEWVYRIDQWAQRLSAVRPDRVGQQIARAADQGNQLLHAATASLVAAWPEPTDRPSAAGRALLTRAGAWAISPPQQIVEVPGATTVR